MPEIISKSGGISSLTLAISAKAKQKAQENR